MKISKILKSAVISLAIVAVVSAGVFASITDCIGKDTANAKYPGLVLKDITTNANVTAPNGFKVKCTTVKEKDASCQAAFVIPEGTTRIELKAKAHNNCGESSTTVSYNVYKDLGKVTNFDIIDTDGCFERFNFD